MTKQQELIPVNGEGYALVAAPTPTTILQDAVRANVPIETLTKLLELQERFEATQARKAFDVAFAAFKAEAPKLERTKGVSHDKGKTDIYKYTPLDVIANALGPILAKHGLSYNWKQESSKDSISVTCILRHTQGHSIENTLNAQPDASGAKNAIQAVGSAVSYLRRYTLLGITGMATSEEDSDGVTMGEAADFLALISEAETLEALKKHYEDAVRDGLKKQSPKAVGLYMEARKKREATLRAA